MLLRREQNKAHISFAVVVASILLFGFCAAEAATPAPASAAVTQSITGDTLHFSPWVQEIAQSWNADSLLSRPRVFCVTSYATWPGFYYIRHVTGRTDPAQCVSSQPVLVQAPVCPPERIRLPGTSGVPWVVVQCGLTRFVSYRGDKPPQPQTGGTT